MFQVRGQHADKPSLRAVPRAPGLAGSAPTRPPRNRAARVGGKRKESEVSMAGGDREFVGSLPAEVSAWGEPEQVHPIRPGLLWLCGLVALACLGPAGMSFYCLWKPFGKNPPPPEVMLGGGVAFVAGGLLLVGMALWVRSLTYLVFPEAL